MPIVTKGFKVSEDQAERLIPSESKDDDYFFVDGCRVDILRNKSGKIMFTHESLIEKDCLSGPVTNVDENSVLLTGLHIVYERACELYPTETSEFTHWIF